VTGDNLLKLLELRLDNVVFRLGFCRNSRPGRQLVGTVLFEVGGKKSDIPSYGVKIGDIIAIRESKRKSGYVEKLKEKIKNFKSQELGFPGRAKAFRKSLKPADSDLSATPIIPSLLLNIIAALIKIEARNSK